MAVQLVHTAKDTGRFKAGWHSKKAVHAIRPDKWVPLASKLIRRRVFDTQMK